MGMIQIEQWPHSFETGKKRILDAALDAGVPFPHGCGTGECGSCKCQVLEGQVSMDKHSPLALSQDERAEGKVLACRARAQGDVSLRWLNAPAIVHPVLKFKTKVLTVETMAHDVVGFDVALPEGVDFRFHPGQFAKLRFHGLPARSYSMANASADGRKLSFHVRVVADGQVSQFVASALKPGMSLELQGPFGEAHWEAHHAEDDGPLLLLGGGTGLAPMISVMEAALAQGVPGERIRLYHGVRAKRDLYAYDYLRQTAASHGISFVPVLSEDDADSPEARSGMLHEVVGQDYADLANAMVFIAGPPPMVDAVKALAQSRNAPEARIRADAFHAAEKEKRGLLARLLRR